MKKILFDASVHFGQFHCYDEKTRIACKNSQVSVSSFDNIGILAHYTYFENGRMDDIIRSLDRDTQDTYYPFMDVYYSNPNITGIADNIEEMSLAVMLANKFPSISSSSAISCALAITRRVDELHTLYATILEKDTSTYLEKTYKFKIIDPRKDINTNIEQKYQDHDLENLYSVAFNNFKKNNIVLIENLHDPVYEK